MMLAVKPNPIRKRAAHYTWHIDTRTGHRRISREWGARCPECREWLRGHDASYIGGASSGTRKGAKDALHRHMMSKHRVSD